MAAEMTIGKLLVQMALDDKDYRSALTGAAAATTEAAKAIGDSASQGTDEAGKALNDLAIAGQKAGAGFKGAAEDVEKAAGLFRDANGKLRDATGKFVTDADALERLKNTIGMTADEIEILQKAADKINLKRLTEMGQDLNATLGDVTDTLRGYIVDAFQAAALSAGAFAAAATYVGSAFQQKMTLVGVIASASKEEMAALTNKARELGATTAFSASQAADAMALLAGAGLNVSDTMATAGDALILAGAGGTTLEKAAATLTATMAQFGLAASDSARIADVLSKATADSQFTVDDLSEALKYGGIAGAGFGWSLEQTVSALAQFRDLGLEGSMAGTALRGAMMGATQASKQHVDILAKYKLTLEDINPETKNFSEIMTTLGKAGITTTDSLVIFGAEAGAAVATLSKQFAAGGDEYQKMLTGLEASAGAATAMYADMQKNVAGAFAELQSASEEVLLTLFDQYSAPLAELLASVSGVINKISQEINNSGTFIQASLKGSFGSVTEWIDQNADYIAKTIAGFVLDLAEFTTEIGKLLPILTSILPLLDDIALTMGLIWITGEVMAFVAAVTEVVGAVTSVGFSLQGLMVVMTEATGGIYALVAGIGVLVAGLATLIARYYDASEAADKLKAAQDRLKQGEVTATAARVAALQGYIDANKEALKQEAVALAGSGQTSSARYKEIQAILALTGATAAQAEAEGKLVMVRGQLRTVGSIAEDLNPEDVAAFRQEVTNLSNESTRAGQTVSALEQAMIKAKAVDPGMYGADAMIASFLRTADSSVTTIEQAQARIEQLRGEQKQTAAAAIALNNEYEKSTAAMLETESRGQKKANADTVAGATSTTKTKIRLDHEYADATATIHADLERQLARIGATDAQNVALDLKDKQQAISEQYAKQENAARAFYQAEITAAKGNTEKQKGLQAEYEAEVLRLEQQKQADLGELYAVAIKEDAQRQMDAEAQKVKDRIAEEKRLQGIINDLEDSSLSESEKLAREKADTLAGIDDSYGAQKAQIAADYDAQITAAQAKEEKARHDAETMSLKEFGAGLKSAASSIAGAFGKTVDAVKAVVGALQSAKDVATGFVDFFSSGLESLTGFSFNLRDAITSVVSAMQDAQDSASQVTMPGGGTVTTAAPASNAAFAATSFVNGLVDGAVTFVQTAADAIPVLITALVTGIPTLIDALVAAIPTVVSALAIAIPALISVFVDAAPQVIYALVAGVPTLVKALVDGLPQIIGMLVGLINSDVIGTLLDGVFSLVQAVITDLPALFIAIVGKVPSIIQALLAQVPTLITGIIAGLIDVVIAVIDAIPQIVDSFLQALPGIIIALVNAIMTAIPSILVAILQMIPKIITSIVLAIPKIFSAILSLLPTIITSLIGMVPDLIMALISGLPAMIPAFIAIIPELITALVQFMPDIVVAFVKALFIELPKQLWQIVPAMGAVLVDAITSAWDGLTEAIGNLFKAAWDAITSIFSKDKDGGSAYSGISYVPATMRMTLHPGEAVVPASRNPAGRGRSADVALAGGRGGGGGSQGSTLQPLQMLVNGRVVEEVLIESGRNGQATKLKQIIRSTSGVKAGLDRGRFQRYSK